MKTHWLWDIRTKEGQAKKILQNENDPRFFIYAKMLFSRNTDVDYVFSLVDKKVFCQNWPLIKEKIKQAGNFFPNNLELWKSVYKKTLKELSARGIKIHKFPDIPLNKTRVMLAKKLREIRIKEGYTQQEAAELLGVTQKYISKLETGRVNVSIDALSKIANIYFKNIEIVFKGAPKEINPVKKRQKILNVEVLNER